MTRDNWRLLLAVGVGLSGCGDDGRATTGITGNQPTTLSDGTTAPTTGDATAPTTTVTATDGSATDGSATDSSATTEAGSATTPTTAGTTGDVPCPDDCEEKGGVCLGSGCCPVDLACDGICCPDAQVCSFNRCESPGAECIDAAECSDGEYCEYSLGDPEMGGGEMCQGGVSLKTGKCLPEPPDCEVGEEPKEGEPITCLPQCEYIPDGSFKPVVKYAWNKADVMMTPIVVQLDDDNCDQIVDERDIPEIVFTTFAADKYTENGTTRAISIVDGKVVEKWVHKAAVDPATPARSIAGGNVDGKPGNEIVTCTVGAKARLLDAAGMELWVSAAAVGCVQPTIADLDNDGVAEVIVSGGILDGATGALKAKLTASTDVFAADLDVDGQLDVVNAFGAYRADGTIMAQTKMDGRFAAIADFDLDGVPEVAVIANGGTTLKHHLLIWRYDAQAPDGVEIVRPAININGALNPALCAPGTVGNTGGGGAPTIADFNGDGTPDVAVAGGVGYAVFDGKKLLDPNVAGPATFLWIKQTTDCSSASTGSSVFDFDGDGTAEVLYGDEKVLHIYKGADGAALLTVCNTSGTLYELPVVADVDSDGHADIIAVSNSYSQSVCNGTKQRGIRVFGDSQGSWVRTRRIWNQHAYYVTNVNEDGSIPAPAPVNWTTPGLNNFRQNSQPEGEFSAPDLIVTLRLQCPPLDYGLVGRVRNIGSASVPPGVSVRFFEGDPAMGGTLLGMAVTTKVLYPAEAEDVVLLLADPPPGVLDGSSTVFVVVDDDMPEHPWHECRVDNNQASGTGQCLAPPE